MLQFDHVMRKPSSHLLPRRLGHVNLRHLLASLVSLLYLMSSPAHVFAQARSSSDELQIEEKSLCKFDACFEDISSQLHSAIFVEGVPIHSYLSHRQFAELIKSLRAFPSTPTHLPELEAIASAYGYDVEVQDKQTIFLRKNYRGQDDLPCVTFPEILHWLQSTDKIINTFSQADKPQPLLAEMRYVNAVLGNQSTSGFDCSRISSLPVDQRALALSAACKMWIGAKTDSLHQLWRELARLDEPTSKFKWLQEHGIDAFGYVGAFGPNHTIVPVPLNNGWSFDVNEGEHHRFVQPNDIDPAVPTQIDRDLASGMLANRMMSTQTMGGFALSNAREQANTVKLAVDNAVVDKPFSCYGAQYVSRVQFIRALAALYGLAVRAPNASDITITLPEPHSMDTVADIPKEIQRIVPLPLARFLANNPVQNSVVLRATASGPASETQQPELQSDSAHMTALESFYYTAVRRLLALTLPLVPTRKSSPLPIRSTSLEEHRLIALAQIAGAPLSALDAIYKLDTPPILNDLGSAFVVSSKTANGFALSFSPDAVLPTGTFHPQLSTGVTNPPSIDNPLLKD